VALPVLPLKQSVVSSLIGSVVHWGEQAIHRIGRCAPSKGAECPFLKKVNTVEVAQLASRSSLYHIVPLHDHHDRLEQSSLLLNATV
jgi:hypothetical protein